MKSRFYKEKETDQSKVYQRFNKPRSEDLAKLYLKAKERLLPCFLKSLKGNSNELDSSDDRSLTC